LISSVCVSLIAIVGLLRGHELAKSRYIDERRRAGTLTGSDITEGKLSTGELLCILACGCAIVFPCRFCLLRQDCVPLLARPLVNKPCS
jgi:hypothetical protein